MASHDSFLGELLQVFPNQVHLVARFSDAALGFDDAATLRVFLPDFHWMSRSCLERYSGGYQFTGNRLLKGRPMFHAFVRILETVKAANEPLEVYQLGDRLDLWREMTKDDPDVRVAYNRVRNDPDVQGLADRLDALEVKYIRGNHDAWLAEVEAAGGIRPSAPELTAAGDNIFLTHGHRYDNIEMILSDSLQAAFVGILPKIKPGTHATGPFSPATMKKLNGYLTLREKLKFPPDFPPPTVVPDGARLIRQAADIDVIEGQFTTFLDLRRFLHGEGIRNDFEHASYLTFGDKIFTVEQNHPRDHHVYVIGHTHHARLLVDHRPSGKLLVTMDCGGWIENCTVYNDKAKQSLIAPSAQVGVQCGNDLRIYQLGGNPEN
jgi:UDP-2,3-diacylglucosamine pyrophosphatase LpxH